MRVIAFLGRRCGCCACRFGRPKTTSIRTKSSRSSPPRKLEFQQARNNYTYRQSVKMEELDPSGNPTGGKWEDGGGHHLLAGGQAHRKGGVRAGAAPCSNISLTPGRRAGSPQRPAVRPDHARDSRLRHPLPRQGKGGRDRLLRVLREAQEDGAGQALLRRPDLGGRPRSADREDLRQRRRRHQEGAATTSSRNSRRTASRSTANTGSRPTPTPTTRCTSRTNSQRIRMVGEVPGLQEVRRKVDDPLRRRGGRDEESARAAEEEVGSG